MGTAVVMGSIGIYALLASEMVSLHIKPLVWIGAPDTVILGLILQQALILGIVGFGIAYLVGRQLFPLFPRRVILAETDLIQLAGIVIGISVVSSVLGIWKAMKVSPNEALA